MNSLCSISTQPAGGSKCVSDCHCGLTVACGSTWVESFVPLVYSFSSADTDSQDSSSPQEKKRQGYIDELLQSEERYVEDLKIVLEVTHTHTSQ